MKKGNFSRREFLGTCASCSAGAAAFSAFGVPFTSMAAAGKELPGAGAKIGLIYAYPDPDKPNWPNIGYDFKGYNNKITKLLKEKCPDVDFLITETMDGSKEGAEKILKANPDVDAYIVYMSGCLWGNIPEVIGASGTPVVMVDNLFAGSGEFLTSFARVKRQGHKVIAVSSSDFNDVVKAVNCINCLKKLKNSTVLVMGANADTKIEETYGTVVKKIEFEEINSAYKKADKAEVKKWTNKWINGAEKVIEPKRTDVEKAAGIYLAMLELMKNHNANAVTINCLGGIYSGKMVEAYPCLGFMQLDNDGLVGACEADQRSTLTKLLMTYFVGRPGFISDPVIDTAKNQIIYAHCVAPTKVFGPAGTSNPYHLRNHSEDRKGACNRSLMPLGEMTTTILFDHNKKQVILHQGKSVENVDDDKACRNKLAVEVKGDVYKLMNYWDQWGWHRVTFYGEHKRQIYNIAALLGFEVVEEA